MFLRRNAALKYLVLGPLIIALYCEWLVYKSQPLFWNDLERNLECSVDNNGCTKVLFIADPQIQGDFAAPPPLNYIYNWDSDRYLKSTFSVVQRHFKPDVMVFLGDLMDEGSISTMEQFHAYVKRLMNIFEVNYPVMQVWLPGDNDIGGENEPIYKDKIAEFDRTFKQPQIITYKNITFYKVNAITHSYPEEAQKPDNVKYKIVVSHYPILTKSIFGKQVNAAIHPNIYFCAHSHESKYVKQSKDFLSHKETYPLQYKDPVLNLTPNNEEWLYEIYVPTCSYRMGTSKIGYGAAIIENHNQNMRYTVFWSPQRFPHLITYLLIGIILTAYILVSCIRYVLSICKKPLHFDKREDSIHLLKQI